MVVGLTTLPRWSLNWLVSWLGSRLFYNAAMLQRLASYNLTQIYIIQGRGTVILSLATLKTTTKTLGNLKYVLGHPTPKTGLIVCRKENEGMFHMKSLNDEIKMPKVS